MVCAKLVIKSSYLVVAVDWGRVVRYGQNPLNSNTQIALQAPGKEHPLYSKTLELVENKQSPAYLGISSTIIFTSFTPIYHRIIIGFHP